jgi:hypothetical protein
VAQVKNGGDVCGSKHTFVDAAIMDEDEDFLIKAQLAGEDRRS